KVRVPGTTGEGKKWTEGAPFVPCPWSFVPGPWSGFCMIPMIHTAAEQIRTGSLSPVDLLEQCLARQGAREADVRAWVLVDRAGARAAAEQRAAEVRAGRWRGPLHGVPVAIKDIFDVFDWPTAAGSQRWAASVARHDATVVRKLREAGAVFLGKTVTT